jgi:hypothetical protein
MRFLLLEHYSSQDVQELRRVAHGIELETIPYEHLRSEALRILPAEVASGLAAFARDELAGARRRYAAVLREMLEDRFSVRPFDAIIVPSDTFFYVRAMPQIAHALGVPFLVAQKETTISEYALREHAEQIRRFAPPCADRMTVCSERHKRFWLNAGGVAERILVTGQPRLDFYSRQLQWVDGGAPARRRARGERRHDATEATAGGEERTVLFLSYALDAYYPGEGSGAPVWADLHRHTERGLHELAERGWRVLVKPHPQQPLEVLRAWRREAGGLWGGRISLVDPQADVRPLIAAADAVVGFQSTAMLEAMLAGRPVVYTGWDPLAASLEEQLIPFQRWREEIAVVEDPANLAETVEAAAGERSSASVSSRRREIAESYLGPLDGRAAERTVAALREEAERWAAQRGAAERQLRVRLARRRRPLRLARRSRVLAKTLRRHLGAALGR